MHAKATLDQRKLLHSSRPRGFIFQKQEPFSRTSKQINRRWNAATADDDDAPPEVSGDWRAFRAGLISKSGKDSYSSV